MACITTTDSKYTFKGVLMAMNLYSFHHWLVGPYSVHWDGSGGLIVARRVNTSSHSSDVLRVLGDASYVRFNSWEELGDLPGNGDVCIPRDDESSLESMYEYVKLCDIPSVLIKSDHSNNTHIRITEMFYTVVKVFGGYNQFVSEVYADGVGLDLDAWMDEDGLDYERVHDYGIRLKIVDEVALRLIHSEGYSIW